MLPFSSTCVPPSLQAFTQIAPLRHHPFTLIPSSLLALLSFSPRCLSVSNTLHAGVCLFVDCCPPQLDFKPHEDKDLFTAESPEPKTVYVQYLQSKISYTFPHVSLSLSRTLVPGDGREVRCGMPSHRSPGSGQGRAFPSYVWGRDDITGM